MTSGNITEEPINIDNQKAYRNLYSPGPGVNSHKTTNYVNEVNKLGQRHHVTVRLSDLVTAYMEWSKQELLMDSSLVSVSKIFKMWEMTFA